MTRSGHRATAAASRVEQHSVRLRHGRRIFDPDQDNRRQGRARVGHGPVLRGAVLEFQAVVRRLDSGAGPAQQPGSSGKPRPISSLNGLSKVMNAVAAMNKRLEALEYLPVWDHAALRT